jgi:23S rRNA (pseudouridine1915-N3)-methyltransferase
MEIRIAAVGRARQDPLIQTYNEYIKRVAWPVRLDEIAVSKAGSAKERKRDEAKALLTSAGMAAKKKHDGALVVLDGTGKALSSEAFAKKLGRWRDDGIGVVHFMIGGPDGLDESIRSRADLKLAFGPMTWPHLMVRVMLSEQLFRASSILSGHPYHRA